ncbi:MAG: SPOR domain-containing protein [Gammaproteobacteria bacterium]|jgi:cell division septation protein DedD|nr:SPOR domain-containing protein [Gammaproteobacteria bacterium]
MARDYAKGKQTAGKKAPARKKPAARASKQPVRSGGAWRWYGAGVLTGVFLSFLLYLGTLPTPGDGDMAQQGEAEVVSSPPKPRFDFYTLLPEQSIEVDVEPAEMAKPRNTVAASTEVYLLQAGSFRQQDDADRRRAELLLLGLEPKVEEASGDNGRWFRVYLGPFESRSRMAKARSLTAAQDIDTLVLKRSQP